MITCCIEQIRYDELYAYMSYQAIEAFENLRDEQTLRSFSTKLFEHAEFCLCRDDGELVGMLAFYANGKGADFAYLTHGYVSPGYRKVGLFTRMVHTIADYVKPKGFTLIRLEVRDDNPGASSAYLRIGFVFDGVASDHSRYMSYDLNG